MEDALVSTKVMEALVQAVQRRLQNNLDAVVPGLGTFSVQHDRSKVVHEPSGGIVIVPPARSISFALSTEGGAVDD